jgi:integrase
MTKVTRAEITKLVAQIRSGKPPKLPEGKSENIYWSPAFYGFGIRLLYTGSASWIWQHKTWGRTHRLAIGDVRVLDEPQAQNAAKNLWAKVQLERLDPQAAKAEAKRTAKIIFEDVAQQYLVAKVRRPRTVADLQFYLTGHYFKPLHRMPLDEITHEQITLQLQKLSSPAMILNSDKTLRAFFTWAIKKGMHPGPSPMLRVDKPPQGKSRTRILTHEEIKTIWLACEAWEVEAGDNFQRLRGKTIPDFARVTRLLFLTGCRAQEIGDLRWSEINWKDGSLLLPSDRTKNKEPLYLPLTDTALNILKSVKQRPGKENVFGTKINKGLPTQNIGPMISRRIAKSGGVVPAPRWVIHDIRRTVRSGMGEIGISSDIAERVVNHVSARSEMQRTYDRFQYGPAKRDALTRWESHLLKIVHGVEEKIVAPKFGRPAGGESA